MWRTEGPAREAVCLYLGFSESCVDSQDVTPVAKVH